MSAQAWIYRATRAETRYKYMQFFWFCKIHETDSLPKVRLKELVDKSAVSVRFSLALSEELHDPWFRSWRHCLRPQTQRPDYLRPCMKKLYSKLCRIKILIWINYSKRQRFKWVIWEIANLNSWTHIQIFWSPIIEKQFIVAIHLNLSITCSYWV